MSGTRINVALGSSISSETANIGDPWRGTVTENVIIQNRGRIPPGSEVDGVVTGVTAGDLGSRAMLELGVRSIRVDGHDERIAARAEPVIAGSERARHLYAITDKVAAKALIGENIGDAEVADAAGVVARSTGGQIILTDGTVMSFTVTVTVAMR
jgi:nucleoid-associated protein YgaU